MLVYYYYYYLFTVTVAVCDSPALVRPACLSLPPCAHFLTTSSGRGGRSPLSADNAVRWRRLCKIAVAILGKTLETVNTSTCYCTHEVVSALQTQRLWVTTQWAHPLHKADFQLCKDEDEGAFSPLPFLSTAAFTLCLHIQVYPSYNPTVTMVSTSAFKNYKALFFVLWC